MALPDDIAAQARQAQQEYEKRRRKRRRSKLFHFSHDTLIGFVEGRLRMARPELPKDVEVLRVSYNISHDGWDVILASEEWEELPEGQLPPDCGIFQAYYHMTARPNAD